MTHYVRYYENQVGGGSQIKNVFSGSTYQRGRGVGAWLGGLFRKIAPYIGSGLKALGKEAVRSGLSALNDMTNDNMDIRNALLKNAREASKRLQQKAKKKISEMIASDDDMKGGGYYKMRAVSRRRQSQKSRVSKRISSRKRKKNIKKRTALKKKRNTKGKKKKKRRRQNLEISRIYSGLNNGFFTLSLGRVHV